LRIILALVIVTGGLAGFYHIDGKRRRHADISGRAGAIASRGRRDGLGSCPITQIRRRGEGAWRLRYFAKGPMKKEYLVLPAGLIRDTDSLRGL
jgi:hypothetical protein